MTLGKPLRNLIVFIIGVLILVLLEFSDDLSSAIKLGLFFTLLSLIIVLVYFVGKEMSPLHNVTAVLLCCFIALFVQLNRVQVLQASEIETVAGNNRELQRNFGQERGRILTSDGQVVALSEPVEGNDSFNFRRRYPHGELYAHSVGYVSLISGSTGLEAEYNEELTAQENILLLDSGPSDLVLGIDHELQMVARESLKDSNGNDRLGSVVAIEPSTGDIKALWSYPSYNPEPIASLSAEEINLAIDELEPDPGIENPKCTDTPLCAKAYQDRTVPGSTFKIVVATAALDRTGVGLFSPDFPVTDAYDLPFNGTGSIRNYGGSSCGGDLKTLITKSCNAGFAQIAVEDLGPEKLIDQTKAYGFNQKVPLDVGPSLVTESFFPEDYGNYISDSLGYRLFDNSPKLGQAAIGQSEVQATPLNMAMVAASVANDGDMMYPRFVTETKYSDSQTSRVNKLEVKKWKDSASRETADDLKEAMYQVVETGTARNSLQIPGLEVGAKTGTADIGDDVHAWVIAFAGRPGQEPELAVAVLVERQQGDAGVTGGKVAGPIARAVFEQYFSSETIDG